MDWNRGPSAYQPNALPLGQTGSRKHQVTDLLTLVWEWELVGGWVGVGVKEETAYFYFYT